MFPATQAISARPFLTRDRKEEEIRREILQNDMPQSRNLTIKWGNKQQVVAVIVGPHKTPVVLTSVYVRPRNTKTNLGW